MPGPSSPDHSAKYSQSVMIGKDISIAILSIEPGGQVNIGISAPRDIWFLRSELQKAVSANQDAADTAPPPLVNCYAPP